MPTDLRYGSDLSLELEVDEDTLLAHFQPPEVEAIDDLSAAVSAALIDPIDFPPLVQATVSGDRIAIALDHDVAQAPAIVAGTIHTLLEGDVQPEEIVILQTPAAAEAGDPRVLLQNDIAAKVELITHDADDRETLMYVATSSDGNAIYINKHLGDADLVIPIGCLHLEESLGYFGMHSGLFPEFADRETQQRYNAPQEVPQAGPWEQRRRESEEVAWLVGISFTIQVLPGPGDTIYEVLAGLPKEVYRIGHAMCERVWRHTLPEQAGIVVAAIEGGESRQSWENVARALSAASAAVEPGGAIALCTDLTALPGPALAQFGGDEDLAAGLREVSRDKSPDALFAAEWLKARERASIYFLSRLDDAVVERLGASAISDPGDIERLSGRRGACIVLANAENTIASPQGEPPSEVSAAMSGHE